MARLVVVVEYDLPETAQNVGDTMRPLLDAIRDFVDMAEPVTVTAHVREAADAIVEAQGRVV